MHPYISLLTTQQSFSHIPTIDLITLFGFRRPSESLFGVRPFSENRLFVYSLCLPSVHYINGSWSYLYGTDRVWMRNRMKYVILKCFYDVFFGLSVEMLNVWDTALFICCSVCPFHVFWVKKCCETDIFKKLSSVTLELTRGCCIGFKCVCFSIGIRNNCLRILNRLLQCWGTFVQKV